MYDVPQGSELRHLLLNINLIDLFLECEDNSINGYEGNTTSYSCAENMCSVKLPTKFSSGLKIVT